jgi:hypothetical protein
LDVRRLLFDAQSAEKEPVHPAKLLGDETVVVAKGLASKP